MRILVLEDHPRRISWFKANLGLPAEYTESAADCIRLLKKSEYDTFYLDHDLGMEELVPSSHLNTGSAVARWMAKNKAQSQRDYHSLRQLGRS